MRVAFILILQMPVKNRTSGIIRGKLKFKGVGFHPFFFVYSFYFTFFHSFVYSHIKTK